MNIERRNGYTKVTVHPSEVAAFKRTWPCSTLPDNTAIEFLFEPNGDLVGLLPDPLDGPDVVALSHDAWAVANGGAA